MATDETPKSGDFLRYYVIVMGLMALALGVLLFKSHSTKKEFEQANALAKAQFGTPDGPGSRDDQKPTTITALAVGVNKYLATYREATLKTGDSGPTITHKTVADRAEGLSLSVKNTGGEQVNKNNAKRYEEVSLTVTFEPTDIERLVKFMYNIESESTGLRILDFRWELRPDKENPYEPGVLGKFGNQISSPQVKIGRRRPLAGASK